MDDYIVTKREDYIEILKCPDTWIKTHLVIKKDKYDRNAYIVCYHDIHQLALLKRDYEHMRSSEVNDITLTTINPKTHEIEFLHVYKKKECNHHTQAELDVPLNKLCTREIDTCTMAKCGCTYCVWCLINHYQKRKLLEYCPKCRHDTQVMAPTFAAENIAYYYEDQRPLILKYTLNNTTHLIYPE